MCWVVLRHVEGAVNVLWWEGGGGGGGWENTLNQGGPPRLGKGYLRGMSGKGLLRVNVQIYTF